MLCVRGTRGPPKDGKEMRGKDGRMVDWFGVVVVDSLGGGVEMKMRLETIAMFIGGYL